MSSVSDPPLDSRSTSELIQDLAELTARLVRTELALAKAEMSAKAKRAGVGAGLIAAAALLSAYAVGALVVGVILAVALVLPAWAAGLVVGAAMLVVAGLLVWQGSRQLKRATPPVPAETIASVRADVDEITTRARR